MLSARINAFAMLVLVLALMALAPFLGLAEDVIFVEIGGGMVALILLSQVIKSSKRVSPGAPRP